MKKAIIALIVLLVCLCLGYAVWLNWGLKGSSDDRQEKSNTHSLSEIKEILQEDWTFTTLNTSTGEVEKYQLQNKEDSFVRINLTFYDETSKYNGTVNDFIDEFERLEEEFSTEPGPAFGVEYLKSELAGMEFVNLLVTGTDPQRFYAFEVEGKLVVLTFGMTTYENTSELVLDLLKSGLK